MDSTAAAILQMEIQERYVYLSRRIGELSASLSRGRAVVDTNAMIKENLVDLVNLASFNPDFYNKVGRQFRIYMLSNADNVTNIRMTLKMWNLISDALRENRIIILKREE